jgi:hypothetical protein
MATWYAKRNAELQKSKKNLETNASPALSLNAGRSFRFVFDQWPIFIFQFSILILSSSALIRALTRECNRRASAKVTTIDHPSGEP